MTNIVTPELAHLLGEIRRRGWTLLRWGPEHSPELVAAMYSWGTWSDVYLLRAEDSATGYRTPITPTTSALNPRVVVAQYHGTAVEVARDLLGLPEPSQYSPEAHSPDLLCRIPQRLPKPFLIRPL